MGMASAMGDTLFSAIMYMYMYTMPYILGHFPDLAAYIYSTMGRCTGETEILHPILHWCQLRDECLSGHAARRRARRRGSATELQKEEITDRKQTMAETLCEGFEYSIHGMKMRYMKRAQ